MAIQFAELLNLGQQQSQRLLTLDERVDASASQASQAVELNNALLRQLVEDVQYVRYQISNPPPRNALDPTKDLDVVLEDALGYRLEVPMDWIDNWDVRIQPV
jgi:hypothetical protein